MGYPRGTALKPGSTRTTASRSVLHQNFVRMTERVAFSYNGREDRLRPPPPSPPSRQEGRRPRPFGPADRKTMSAERHAGIRPLGPDAKVQRHTSLSCDLTSGACRRTGVVGPGVFPNLSSDTEQAAIASEPSAMPPPKRQMFPSGAEPFSPALPPTSSFSRCCFAVDWIGPLGSRYAERRWTGRGKPRMVRPSGAVTGSDHHGSSDAVMFAQPLIASRTWTMPWLQAIIAPPGHRESDQ